MNTYIVKVQKGRDEIIYYAWNDLHFNVNSYMTDINNYYTKYLIKEYGKDNIRFISLYYELDMYSYNAYNVLNIIKNKQNLLENKTYNLKLLECPEIFNPNKIEMEYKVICSETYDIVNGMLIKKDMLLNTTKFKNFSL